MRTLTAMLLTMVGFTACSSHSDDTTASASGPRRALVTDWLNQTLTLVDLDALVDGATRESASVATIDLSAYSPGPLDAAISPDGKLALVSVSAGWLSATAALVGVSSIPPGTGTLLFVDLEQRAVVGELDTGSGPMGIQFTHDGKRAFVAHFATSAITIVDVEQRTVVEQVQVGQFSEEIALDDTGTVGIFSYSTTGNVRTFAASDPAGTLSDPVNLTSDAAGVAFFPGTKTAYVVQSATPLDGERGGHTIVDVSDPSAPVVSEDVREPGGPTTYPVAAVPKRGSVVVPATASGMFAATELALGADGTTQVVQIIPVAPAGPLGPYGVSVDPVDGRVYFAAPKEHFIAVVDLASAQAFTIPWHVTASGPTELVPIPVH